MTTWQLRCTDNTASDHSCLFFFVCIVFGSLMDNYIWKKTPNFIVCLLGLNHSEFDSFDSFDSFGLVPFFVAHRVEQTCTKCAKITLLQCCNSVLQLSLTKQKDKPCWIHSQWVDSEWNRRVCRLEAELDSLISSDLWLRLCRKPLRPRKQILFFSCTQFTVFTERWVTVTQSCWNTLTRFSRLIHALIHSSPRLVYFLLIFI